MSSIVRAALQRFLSSPVVARRLKTIRYCLLGLFFLGLAAPENPIIPIQGFPRGALNPDSFWTCPWCGPDSVHWGLDMIFDRGTPVLAATSGIVIYRGWHSKAGQVVAILGPKWRVHYYGHLDGYRTHWGAPVLQGSVIGIVGNTGPSDLPHLHYSIISPIPYVWRWDGDKLGWWKMFFLNPYEALTRNK